MVSLALIIPWVPSIRTKGTLPCIPVQSKYSSRSTDVGDWARFRRGFIQLVLVSSKSWFFCCASTFRPRKVIWLPRVCHSIHTRTSTSTAHQTTRRGLTFGFDIDLNADLSVTVSWSASEFDDETERGSVNGGANVAKNAGLSWNHLVVANDDSNR